ncbi:23S rRNA (uracil(1939)-C(5))-methyltransferase RlmD [Aquibacillus koreensis]|uniref:23S rRNA (Uracil(1939)-C(5))-methyltransferase RlmD n=1 Tax=Aquibacillus koreensis TaxID=279446 RepID=A0A9X3WQ70_9BACI|nr:23S rRNA (uracil(1939)-C(5))-methyltransferase RlmD [Aquibacillus koreensis]MCT2536819.1 23S rRNA (uracil(1939)-C(5))-methyltransferase RlmD [Aquibacillus koreensis]MDC3421424.1 23S rRNA (uracil(1939)-C(5))-methyltransferase RlmD [Aquibacillus koreensis]
MVKQEPPVKKNQTIELTFEDITHEGDGVGKIEGYPLFVPYALPGEKAQVKVIKVKKNFAFGKLLHIDQVSEDRVEPPCDVYIQCGGCQLQHMNYGMQLEMKRNQVKNVLRKIAHIDDIPVHPTIGMDDPWRYRNKVQIPVGHRDGELITGFYRKRTHEIIEGMDTCIITSEINDRMVEAVRRIADRLGISHYDEEKHRGVLRHIMVRTGQATEETMIVLVTRTEELPYADELVKELHETYPQIKSIVQNINKQRTNVILGRKTKLLWGEEYIYDTIGDIKFAISAKSFYQVNPPQTKKLYDKALEYADLSGGETVIDAYCGIGTISLFLAQKAKKVYGVEIVPEAISDAKENAKLNNIDNTEFVVGEAEKVMPWWTAQGLRPDVIVVDPPRKGCDEALLEAMITMKPKKIVYVSCNPSTLARDLKILEDGGYETKQVQPVDMFPQTNHVECVAEVVLKLSN